MDSGMVRSRPPCGDLSMSRLQGGPGEIPRRQKSLHGDRLQPTAGDVLD